MIRWAITGKDPVILDILKFIGLSCAIKYCPLSVKPEFLFNITLGLKICLWLSKARIHFRCHHKDFCVILNIPVLQDKITMLVNRRLYASFAKNTYLILKITSSLATGLAIFKSYMQHSCVICYYSTPWWSIVILFTDPSI